MKGRLAWALGLALLLGSALAYPRVLRHFRRAPLALALQAPDFTPQPRARFRVASDLPLHIDGERNSGDAPLASGLHYLQWQRHYAGGHSRSVGHAQLVGPLQDPAAPPCSTYLLIDQSLLDDEKTGLAPLLTPLLEEELRGFAPWPLGRFRRIAKLRLQWRRWHENEGVSRLRSRLQEEEGREPANGHLAVSMVLHFEEARVPIHMSLVPWIFEGVLHFHLAVRAELDFDSRIYQLVSRLLDGDDRVSRVARAQLGEGLRYLIDEPPALALGGDASIELSFCEGRQLHFHEDSYLSVPLAIALSDRQPPPPLKESGPRPEQRPQSPLAVDIDENGLNALLHRLWSSGILDRELGTSLVAAFNEQQSVRDFLSLRLEGAAFHLPPSLELNAGAQRLRMRAAASARLRDGPARTEARLFSQISVGLGALEPGGEDALPGQLAIETMDMSCLGEKRQLRDCYGAILEQLRANQEPLQEMLAESLRDLLHRVLVKQQIGDAATPAHFALQRPRWSLHPGWLRAELAGQLVKTTN